MQTIAIVNEKGGTGKTTTAVNLSAALGHLGKRVLLVDLDGQAASSRWLGVEEDNRLAEAMIRGGGLVPIENVIANISLAPATGKLDSVAHDLRPTQGGQLRKVLAELKDRYDFVMIDCPPSLGNRLIGNAMLAASHMIVPVETSILALDGLKILLTTLEDVRDGFGHNIILGGVVACRFDARTRLSHLVVAELRRALPNKVFHTVIRENVRMRECPASGESILTFAPDSHAAEDYLSLAREMLEHPDFWQLPAPVIGGEAAGQVQPISVESLRDSAAASVRAAAEKSGWKKAGNEGEVDAPAEDPAERPSTDLGELSTAALAALPEPAYTVMGTAAGPAPAPAAVPPVAMQAVARPPMLMPAGPAHAPVPPAPPAREALKTQFDRLAEAEKRISAEGHEPPIPKPAPAAVMAPSVSNPASPAAPKAPAPPAAMSAPLAPAAAQAPAAAPPVPARPPVAALAGSQPMNKPSGLPPITAAPAPMAPQPIARPPAVPAFAPLPVPAAPLSGAAAATAAAVAPAGLPTSGPRPATAPPDIAASATAVRPAAFPPAADFGQLSRAAAAGPAKPAGQRGDKGGKGDSTEDKYPALREFLRKLEQGDGAKDGQPKAQESAGRRFPGFRGLFRSKAVTG